MEKTGVLLLNIGTPAEPTPEAVRAFLVKFLNDPYVVDYPKWFWKPILNNIILKRRPARVAKKYEQIWWEEGSPLMVCMNNILNKLGNQIPEMEFALGMLYTEPSIKQGLAELMDKGCTEIVLFPLFPQFTHSTSGSIIDNAIRDVEASDFDGAVKVIQDYHDHPAYIDATVKTIRDHQDQAGTPDQLVLSYHSIPLRYIKQYQDPYVDQCYKTTELIAEKMGLDSEEILTVFQSKFGFEPWVGPGLEDEIMYIAKEKKSVDVACPGFSTDGLETLEEVRIEAREIYEGNFGPRFSYIPALNDKDIHIKALGEIIPDKMKEG